MKPSPATYLSSFLLLWLVMGIASHVEARQHLGVIWEVPAATSEREQELQTFAQSGVEILEIEHPVSSELKTQLEGYPFDILIQSNQRDLIMEDIRTQRASLMDEYRNLIESSRNFSSLAGLGLLANSQVYHAAFDTVFTPLLDTLSTLSNQRYYFRHGPQWLYFNRLDTPFGFLFFDDEFQEADLHTDPAFLTTAQQASGLSPTIHFVHSQWLLQALQQYPEFKKSLAQYQETGHWNLPLPDSRPSPESFNWLVVLVLLLWGGLALQLKFLPYVRPMMLRYFLAHRFFVDDILQYRERAAVGGMLLMIKHALFGGITFYITSRILFTEQGLSTLFSHYPALALTGNYHISIFFVSAFVLILLQLLSVIWLYIPAKNLNHFSQIINLYASPFYLDFIVVTILVTAFLAGVGSTVILAFATTFVLIWYAAFNMAGYNASIKMGPARFRYLMLTLGLHNAVLLLFFIVIATQTDILQVISLALSL